jgi:two-component sensor histidine kinase
MAITFSRRQSTLFACPDKTLGAARRSATPRFCLGSSGFGVEMPIAPRFRPVIGLQNQWLALCISGGFEVTGAGPFAWIGRSLKARLLVFAIAALAPGLFLVALNESEIRKSRAAEINELALRGAKNASSELDRIVAGVESVLVAVSRAPVMLGEDGERCNAYVAEVVQRLANLSSMAFMNIDGSVRCTSLPNAQGFNFSDKSYFRDALASSGGVIGEYTIGRMTGKPVLPIALAARDKNGEATGVLVGAVDLAWLDAKLKERGLPSDGSLTVSDRKGIILAREPFPERFVGTKIPEEFMRLVDAPSEGAETVTSQDGVRRVLGFVPISQPPVGLYVSAGLSAAASFEAVDRAGRMDALLAGLAIIATLAATWQVGRRAFVEPVRRITRVVENWRAGDQKARTHFGEAQGEIGELGATVDRLFDEITRGRADRDLLEQELIHRVKNTLATVQAIAAQTMNKPAAAAEVLPTFLSRIRALAQTHEVLTRERWEAADLNEVIRKVVSALCDDVDARFHIDGPRVELPAREALAMTMVMHELCTNALKYGALKEAGTVAVEWTLSRNARDQTLQLAWRENSAAPVKVGAPLGKGFGTRLIGVAFGASGSTKLEIAPTGLICLINVDVPNAPDSRELAEAPAPPLRPVNRLSSASLR